MKSGFHLSLVPRLPIEYHSRKLSKAPGMQTYKTMPHFPRVKIEAQSHLIVVCLYGDESLAFVPDVAGASRLKSAILYVKFRQYNNVQAREKKT